MDAQNQVMQGLFARKSVRAYEKKPISPEMKQAILQAMMAAPTAGNQQLYTVLDITDQALKDHLAVTCDNQPFIAKAPLVLVFLADCQKWRDAFLEAGADPRAPGVGDLMLAVTDCCIAAQNAVVAAESLGIRSCYIGDIMERCEEHRQLLGLPDYVFPAAMLVFGYPTEQQRQRAKPDRCDLADIVHENRYRKFSGADLRRMFRGRTEGRGYDDWMAAFCQRKFNSDFSREMTRSVAAYLKAFEGQRS
ncbi:MAG: nitroreductase family protein [Oscillospiraceae bacterium]|jgi:nitroreductase|nr:nitroreductase family protein [Oscillospiraceae bacterium]